MTIDEVREAGHAVRLVLTIVREWGERSEHMILKQLGPSGWDLNAIALSELQQVLQSCINWYIYIYIIHMYLYLVTWNQRKLVQMVRWGLHQLTPMPSSEFDPPTSHPNGNPMRANRKKQIRKTTAHAKQHKNEFNNEKGCAPPSTCSVPPAWAILGLEVRRGTRMYAGGTLELRRTYAQVRNRFSIWRWKSFICFEMFLLFCLFRVCCLFSVVLMCFHWLASYSQCQDGCNHVVLCSATADLWFTT